jgi:DNA-binding NtrC family response regulator
MEDLPHLIRAFLGALGAVESEHLFAQSVVDELAKHEWPGNVRELRNYVERSVVLQTARLTLPPPPPSPATEARGEAAIDLRVPFKVGKDALIDAFERAYVRAALDACGGNMTRAARMAGIDRMYLHRLVQKLGTRGGSGNTPSTPPTTPSGAG